MHKVEQPGGHTEAIGERRGRGLRAESGQRFPGSRQLALRSSPALAEVNARLLDLGRSRVHLGLQQRTTVFAPATFSAFVDRGLVGRCLCGKGRLEPGRSRRKLPKSDLSAFDTLSSLDPILLDRSQRGLRSLPADNQAFGSEMKPNASPAAITTTSQTVRLRRPADQAIPLRMPAMPTPAATATVT